VRSQIIPTINNTVTVQMRSWVFMSAAQSTLAYAARQEPPNAATDETMSSARVEAVESRQPLEDSP